jgi:hypothetical protein
MIISTKIITIIINPISALFIFINIRNFSYLFVQFICKIKTYNINDFQHFEFGNWIKMRQLKKNEILC